jgi:biopolymer transport protein ExbB/TolQ
MKTKRRLAMAGTVIGWLLTLAPLLGMGRTIVGMIQAFSASASSSSSAPNALAASVGTTLKRTEVGFTLCPIGIVILVASSIARSRITDSTPPSLPDPPSS